MLKWRVKIQKKLARCVEYKQSRMVILLINVAAAEPFAPLFFCFHSFQCSFELVLQKKSVLWKQDSVLLDSLNRDAQFLKKCSSVVLHDCLVSSLFLCCFILFYLEKKMLFK